MSLLGLGDRALHAVGGGRQHEFRAQDREHLAALDRHRIRHHEDELVALRGGDEGERDAGIAGCRLDQRILARRDPAGLLHRLDHADADAILHAGQRIEELELREQVGLDALLLRELVEPHERRIPIVSVIEA